MHGFSPVRHDLILFDEASAQMVVTQQKLFQCPPVEVTLGASSTLCYAYKVYVHGTAMVIASNRWSTQLRAMASEDADWLRANQVLLQVDGPMWIA